MANEKPQKSPDVGGAGPCARLVREVIGRLAAAEVRDHILREALAGAGLGVVPEDAASFGSFACSTLRDVVERTLGEDAAAAVIADVSPAFMHEGGPTSSGVRRRKGASLAPPTLDAPVVLIASAEAREVDALVARLKERAKVIAAFDVFALLSAASRHLDGAITLLLNDEMPAMDPSTLATLARVLPPGTRIITWGRAEVAPEARAQQPEIEWMRLGPVEDIEAVADVCMARWPNRAEAQPEPRPMPPRRVVIAHDDPTWRARVSRLLSEAGYVVLSAPDGFMAFERCVEEEPVAVIAGRTMSTLDGAQLAALLRGRYADDAPPVLLVDDGPLAEPPPGVVAMIRNDALDVDLLQELAAWIGPGA